MPRRVHDGADLVGEFAELDIANVVESFDVDRIKSALKALVARQREELLKFRLVGGNAASDCKLAAFDESARQHERFGIGDLINFCDALCGLFYGHHHKFRRSCGMDKVGHQAKAQGGEKNFEFMHLEGLHLSLRSDVLPA